MGVSLHYAMLVEGKRRVFIVSRSTNLEILIVTKRFGWELSGMIALTGATGLTGRFLVSSLREYGYQGIIRCLVRPTSCVEDMPSDKRIQYYTGDCTNVESLIQFLQDAKSLIHVANIRYSENVISACQASGVARITVVSTTGIYSQYQKYASEYIEIEEKIKNSGLDYTIIRPTMIYGNHRDKNIHKLVKIVDRLPIVPLVGAGDSLMQPIYAMDLANVIAAAHLNDVAICKEYNVAGKEPITYKSLMEEIAKALAKKRLFVSVPYSLCLACGYLGEVIPNGLINLERIQRLKEDKAFDYSLARDEVGFSPRSFQEGVVLEIQALRETGMIS